MLGKILLIILICMLVGAIPTWPHRRAWGSYPSSGLGLILLIVIITDAAWSILAAQKTWYPVQKMGQDILKAERRG